MHLSLYLQNRHDEFNKKYYWGKNCTPITTGNNHWTAVQYYASNL